MKVESQTEEKSWISDDNMLLFEFTLLRFYTGSPSIVNFKISRIGRDRNSPPLEGSIGERTEYFEQLFPDGYKVKGALSAVIFDDPKTEIGVFGNIFYNNPVYHFEGVMVAFAASGPLPPYPPPPPDPKSRDPGEIMTDVELLHSGESDLFPYIYLHIWPKTPDETVEKKFITYPVDFAASGSLYETLKQLNQAPIGDRRANMLNACVTFTGSNQFFGPLNEIPMPYGLLPGLFDYLCQEDKCDRRILPEEIYLYLQMEPLALMEWIMSPEFKVTMDQVWQNYFALTILQGYAEALAQKITKLIMAANILEKMLSFDGSELIHASVLLPGEVFPLPAAGTLPLPAASQMPAPASPDGSIRALAIGLLQMVRQRLLRYEPGEIARIDNILKGEKKRITWRSLDRSQDIREDRNSKASSSTETGMEDTADLLTETKRTVADVKTLTTYHDFQTTYGPPCNAILKGSWSSEIIPTAGSPEITDVTDFAKKILHQTTSRIRETVYRSRIQSTLSEIERSHSSIFDNSRGNTNCRGIYRWLNKVYQARVVRYGYRLILEIKIDHPATAYRERQNSLDGDSLQRPLDPAAAGIVNFTTITRDNFIALCVQYEVEQVSLPPEEKKMVSVTLQNDENRQTVLIPAGYQAAHAHLAYSFASGATQLNLNGAIGRSSFSYNTRQGVDKIPMHGEDSTVQVSAISQNTPSAIPYAPDDFVLNVEVESIPSDKLFSTWQLEIYQRIMAGYQRQKVTYYAYRERQKNAAEQGNPALYRQIERAELISSCEKLLLDTGITKTGDGQDESFPQPTGINEQEYRSFFREAFEWKEMSYTFDGAGKNPFAPGRIGQMDDDSLHVFLQASSASLLLPVKPDFNFQVIYYLSSGMIWTGNRRFVPVIIKDLPVASELKKFREHKERTESASWEILVPGSMQIIQEGEQL